VRRKKLNLVLFTCELLNKRTPSFSLSLLGTSNKAMFAASLSHRLPNFMSFSWLRSKNKPIDTGEHRCLPTDYSITLMFMAHAGVNQVQLWDRWYASASKEDRARIHVVWWMDHRSSESLSPVQARSTMFTEGNRYASTTSTYRYHHTQATIELELLQCAQQRYPTSHHYHLVSGACIPIKPPARFLRVRVDTRWRTFLDPNQSHIPLFQHEPLVLSHAKALDISWIDQHLAKNHFQFWIFNNDHAQRILALAKECLPSLIAIQQSMFDAKMKQTGFKYNDLTIPGKMKETDYAIEIPSPPEWFFSTLLLEALKRKEKESIHHRSRKPVYIPDLIETSINQTSGIWQDHAVHGVDHHPIEFESMDKKVVIRGEPEYQEASLRQILNENIIASSESLPDNLALWRDVNVHIVRKVGRKPFLEDTWFS
jgi:hypothetical protein